MADAIHAGDSGESMAKTSSYQWSDISRGRSSPRTPELLDQSAKLSLSFIFKTKSYDFQVFYKAHGSNMSWQWLGIITLCVNVLQKLAKGVNEILGYDQGLQHTPVDLNNDIATLMDSLEDQKVYSFVQGQKLDNDQAVPDVVSVGLQSLTSGIDIEDLSPPVGPLTSRSPSPDVATPDSSLKSSFLVANLGSFSATNRIAGTEDEDADREYSEEEYSGELDGILDHLQAELQEPALGLYTAANVALSKEDFDNFDLGEGGRDEDAPEKVDNDPEVEIEEPQMDFFTF
ncbi:hypothetical protein GYMLUDRAFT_58999 [Collybiopsis luxurians FD-317 M1]|uniref:DUF6589 domain-containing protein n=1 Tax=Collybiopsis luxurians FD-317 M1 TaxID=944289 RepID=A0A0D0CQ04_9AGAR|nr:hypothetical protein GYMLUDRAFT_58999 [Collybiopsis luxurians FD-317 M1]